MPDVIVIQRGSAGQTVEQTQNIPSTDFVVTIDGEKYSPAITKEVEIENVGEEGTVTDQCGNTERSRSANLGWRVRVSGIITKNNRAGNLSVSRMKQLAGMSTVQIDTAILSGSIIVSNIIITQVNDLVAISTDGTDGQEDAFEFQLVLGEEESEN